MDQRGPPEGERAAAYQETDPGQEEPEWLAPEGQQWSSWWWASSNRDSEINSAVKEERDRRAQAEEAETRRLGVKYHCLMVLFGQERGRHRTEDSSGIVIATHGPI